MKIRPERVDVVSLFVAVIVLLIGVTEVRADQIVNFKELMNPGSPLHKVGNEDGDPMLLTDIVTGLTFPVPDDEEWHMAFLMDVSGGMVVVGYAENLTGTYGGLMDGSYNEDLPDGQKPDSLWLVWDQNKDGLGVFDEGTGAWIRNSDDILFGPDDILFGDTLIRGDVSQLPAINHANLTFDYVWLPHMVLSPLANLIPGDANSDWLVDGADLALWQQNYDPLGHVLENAWQMGDFTGDGKIDGADLALWQQNYDPLGSGAMGTVPEPATMFLLGTGVVGMFGFARRRMK